MARKRSAPSRTEKSIGLLSPTGHVSAHALDYFVNQAARLGYGTPSLPESTQYELVRFSYDYWTLITLYRNHFLCRKIIDLPAEDMIRSWPKLASDMAPEDEVRIDRVIRRTNTRAQAATAVKWSRLFGGAGALIIVDGHEHQLDEPLDLDDIKIGSYRGLIPFDRWAGITVDGTVCTDITRPLDFNKPEFYTVRAEGGNSFKVHCSRILRFLGPEVPTPEREAQSWWGISVLEPAYEVIKMFDNLLFSILNLTFRSNLLGMKFPDLAELLSGLGMSGKAAQNFEARMSAINHQISTQSLIPLPKDGDLQFANASFAGLDTVFQTYQLNVCSATGIPMTRLWGRTLTGLGQTNDGDEKIYEEKIATDADYVLRPALEKLYPVICASELGEVPDDLDLDFPSIRVLDEKEKADLAKAVVDTVTVALNDGGISLRTYAQELASSSDKTGIFTNVTKEFIKTLPDTVKQEGEVGGDLFPEGENGETEPNPSDEEGGTVALDPSASPQKVLKETAKEHKAEEPEDNEQARGLKVPVESKDAGRLVRANDAQPAPPGLKLGSKVQVNGKTLVVASVAEGTRDLFNRPTVQVTFRTGEVIPYYVEDGAHEDRFFSRTQDEFKESEHPRQPDGKFGKGGGSSSNVARYNWADEDSLSVVSEGDGEVIDLDAHIAALGARAEDSDGPAVGRRVIHGIECMIENPRGSLRAGRDAAGRPWSVTMPYAYGFIPGVPGADGDSMDVAVGPESNGWAYVIDQRKLDAPGFDEHKVFINWPSADAALTAFKAGHHRWHDVMLDWTPMPVDELKRWLKDGDHDNPVGGKKP